MAQFLWQLSCSDVNECVVGTDLCSLNAGCSNTEGSYSCSCDSGYSGNGSTCDDVDDCATSVDNCDANATCSPDLEPVGPMSMNA